VRAPHAAKLQPSLARGLEERPLTEPWPSRPALAPAAPCRSECIEEKKELAFLKSTCHTFNSGRSAPPPTRKRAGAGGAAAGKLGKPAAPAGLAGASAAGLDVTAADGSTLPAMVGADRALEECDDDYDE
jgi:hypothetical protein